MKVNFAPTFFDSIKRMNRHDSWWYKTWSLFRWDIWRFFRNIRHFRKELWAFYPWDSGYTLQMLRKSLELTKDAIDNGYEVPESKNKKVAKMGRAIEILDNFIDDKFIDLAEEELGLKVSLKDWNFEPTEDGKCMQLMDTDTPQEKRNNSRIFARTRRIEEAQWKELWKIIQGQSEASMRNHMVKLTDGMKSPTPEQEEAVQESVFDGSGLRTWWD